MLESCGCAQKKRLEILFPDLIKFLSFQWVGVAKIWDQKCAFFLKWFYVSFSLTKALSHTLFYWRHVSTSTWPKTAIFHKVLTWGQNGADTCRHVLTQGHGRLLQCTSQSEGPKDKNRKTGLFFVVSNANWTYKGRYVCMEILWRPDFLIMSFFLWLWWWWLWQFWNQETWGLGINKSC